MTTTQPPRRVQQLSGGFTVTTFPVPPRELHLVDATDLELAHFGLPPRPDRKLEESLYARWYRTFERPMSFLIPNFEELWEVRHLPRTRSIVNEELALNWSGVVVYAQKGDSINRAVAAEWVVPTPKNVDGGDDYCSIWIGIDGDPSQDPAGANNLLQAGIEAKVDASGIPVCFAWWEWLSSKYRVPEVSIPNFRLVPGDYVETQIWVTSDTTANVCMFSSNDASALTTALFSISAPLAIRYSVVAPNGSWNGRPSAAWPRHWTTTGPSSSPVRCAGPPRGRRRSPGQVPPLRWSTTPELYCRRHEL
jgi:hypothetical protein